VPAVPTTCSFQLGVSIAEPHSLPFRDRMSCPRSGQATTPRICSPWSSFWTLSGLHSNLLLLASFSPVQGSHDLSLIGMRSQFVDPKLTLIKDRSRDPCIVEKGQGMLILVCVSVGQGFVTKNLESGDRSGIGVLMLRSAS
jgi:hypothetical protein